MPSNVEIMKKMKLIVALVLAATFAAAPLVGFAAEAKKSIKPYPLAKCLVSDEKLGGMGDPYIFNYKGQEIKLCCKGCLKDFDKDPKKFLKAAKEKK